MIFGMLGANLCSGLVDTEFGLHTSLGSAFEETQNMLAMLVLLLLLPFLGFSLCFSRSLVVVLVDGFMNLIVRSIQR